MRRHIKKLSIVIPCYNEIHSIEGILKEISTTDLGHIEKEIIIVDDGSKDGTKELLKKISNQKGLIILFQDKNQGKTAAVIRGILKSTGDLLIVQDADLEYDPNDYKKLIRPFEVGRADVVYGSRFIGDSPRRMVYLSNKIANKMMTTLSNLLSGLKLSDIHTCYIMVAGDLLRELAPQMTSNKFGFNPEMAARLGKYKRQKDIRIYETGVSYYGRTKSEGKKIGLRDGIDAVRDIIYYNFILRSK